MINVMSLAVGTCKIDLSPPVVFMQLRVVFKLKKTNKQKKNKLIFLFLGKIFRNKHIQNRLVPFNVCQHQDLNRLGHLPTFSVLSLYFGFCNFVSFTESFGSASRIYHFGGLCK